MARVTVEDCVDKIPNRFELVLLAAHRARAITSGSALVVDRDNDKNPVVSLREIASSKIKPDTLREEFVLSLQRHIEQDEPDVAQAALNEVADVPEFAHTNPTAENIVVVCWNLLHPRLPAGVTLHRLVLAETERNVVEYRGG